MLVARHDVSGQLLGATIEHYFRVINRFNLAPHSGRALWNDRSQGLKPWAETLS